VAKSISRLIRLFNKVPRPPLWNYFPPTLVGTEEAFLVRLSSRILSFSPFTGVNKLLSFNPQLVDYFHMGDGKTHYAPLVVPAGVFIPALPTSSFLSATMSLSEFKKIDAALEPPRSILLKRSSGD